MAVAEGALAETSAPYRWPIFDNAITQNEKPMLLDKERMAA